MTDEEMLQRLGALTREMRDRRGFSQQQLADMIDVARSRLASLESGGPQEPGILMVIRIARALGAAPSKFIAKIAD